MLGRRYQLDRELGRGASGAVYRGRDLANGRLIGVVPYRLACGRLPFSASSRPQFAHRIVNEAHADILSIDSSLPATLGAMLDRALAKLPAARFPSIAAFAGAVPDVTAGLLLANSARAR